MNNFSTEDRIAQAFVQTAAPKSGQRILDLGWEGACLGQIACAYGARTWYVADDIRDVRRCREHSCQSANLTVVHCDTPLGCTPKDMDVVLYRPQQRAAKPQVFEWIDAGFVALAPGGRFFLYGRNDRGLKSYAQRLERVFENLTPGPRIGKGRVFWAEKRCDAPGVPPVQTGARFQAEDLPGGPYCFATRAGAFSRDGVDPGSRLLIGQLALGPDAQVLDVGCGWGLLGIVCARLAPQGAVHMVDVSYRAVACARENIRTNCVENACVAVGDGCEDLAQRRFDLIVSNPPFHEGNITGHAFIDGAARLLNPGGRLMLVVMRPIPYLRRMRGRLADVDVVVESGGYAVLSGCQKSGTL